MTHGDPKRGGRHGDRGLQIGRQGWGNPPFVKNQEETILYLVCHSYPTLTIHRAIAEEVWEDGRPLPLAKYYTICEWFDETCGELLGIIDDEGLRKETVVIYVTDNGWIQRTPDMDLGPKWRSSYAPKSKQSPNEGGIRTPIMVRWPGQVRPGNRGQLVSSIDIAPTILSWLDWRRRN